MRNLLEFLKKTWLLFLLLFIAPIVVILVFATKEYIFHDIDLTAGEWANLLGCMFSYWGTILLGTLAFWQNDRIMRLEERNAEIQETELKLKNTPDFMIDKIFLTFGETYNKELELESIDDSENKEVYQCEVEYKENLSLVALHIELKNTSDVSAVNVGVFESVVNKKLKNRLFVLGTRVLKSIGGKHSLVLTYYTHFDDIKPQNGVKYVEYSFNLNYENIYHHPFYNHMCVFVGTADNKISIQVSLGELHNGKKGLEPKTVNSDSKL